MPTTARVARPTRSGPTQPVRTPRRERSLRRILAAGWELSRERGLAGWTVRDLGDAVGVRAPSLYGYFASKHHIYDALFADGYQQLLDEYAAFRPATDPRETVRRLAHAFVAFCVAEPARCQLLFLRTIPGFEPSPESYELARRALDLLATALADAGVREPADVDLWTAVLTGLATQQISNDPGGDRWTSLVDTAVARLLP